MVTAKDIQLLDEIFESREIKYVLTGTAALYYHGFLPQETEVRDIDVIIVTSKETRPALRAMFKELEKFSGCENVNSKYDSICHTFKIGANNTIVNAIEGEIDDWDNHSHDMLIDGTLIRIHDVMEILAAKFSLRRQKDVDFYLKLINQLNSIFLCSKK